MRACRVMPQYPDASATKPEYRLVHFDARALSVLTHMQHSHTLDLSSSHGPSTIPRCGWCKTPDVGASVP